MEYRKLLEERGDAVAGAADELLEARQQMADLAVKYDAAQDAVAELKYVSRNPEVLGNILIHNILVCLLVLECLPTSFGSGSMRMHPLLNCLSLCS